MKCIMCHHPAGYNRAVVDVLSGQEISRICRNCEIDHFGRRLEVNDAVTEDNCVFCSRDGLYALPKFSVHLEENDGILISKNTAEVSDSAPQICDRHLREMEMIEENQLEGREPEDIMFGRYENP